MVAQLTSNSSQAHKLYVNRSMGVDNNIASTLTAAENGTYKVSIFSIIDDVGILGSNVEYTDEVTVGRLATAPITTAPITT